MSRNFELMLKSQHHDALRPRLGPRIVPAARRPLPHDAGADHAILPLVRRLFLAPRRESDPRRVMFATVDAAGGSAGICGRAARALAAAAAGTVCAVDLDLTAPSLHRALGASVAPGVADVIDRPAGYIETREIAPGLALLPAGLPTHDSGALTPEGVTALLDELAEAFDWVLADLGHLEPGGAAPALSGAADGIVLVVQAHATRRDAALRAKEAITSAGGRLLGTVLTERSASDAGAARGDALGLAAPAPATQEELA